MRTLLPALLLATPLSAADLTVYTYDSFVADWGPGPAIEAGFEATCACDIEFVAAGDGAALLSRLRLEGDRTKADVVLGLDTNLMAEAGREGIVQPHGLTPPAFDLPVEWTDNTFLPYDWGWFAFVHDATLQNVPASFEDLADSDLTIVIQDPRSSTPGLGLVLWIEAAYGDRAADIWEGLADNIVTVTPGWSEAYGLFLAGEADMVLSYTTSPAYHLIAEDDDTKRAAIFAEGHYLQVEVMALSAKTDAPDLARNFLAYMMSDAAQSILPTTNWMYPATTPEGGLPDGFQSLNKPETSLLLDPDAARDLRQSAIETWRTALSR